jgi:hypothetical protein
VAEKGKEAWRIGIKNENKKEIISHGLSNLNENIEIIKKAQIEDANIKVLLEVKKGGKFFKDGRK